MMASTNSNQISPAEAGSCHCTRRVLSFQIIDSPPGWSKYYADGLRDYCHCVSIPASAAHWRLLCRLLCQLCSTECVPWACPMSGTVLLISTQWQVTPTAVNSPNSVFDFARNKHVRTCSIHSIFIFGKLCNVFAPSWCENCESALWRVMSCCANRLVAVWA